MPDPAYPKPMPASPPLSPPEAVLSVSELTLSIKKQLESRFAFVTVKGEISNLKEQSSGHLYFTLKDANAQISAVLFQGYKRSLARPPKGGDQVICQGEISVYPPRGNYQILVKEMRYVGVGELLMRFHELKVKLEARGWFDKGKKKPLPHLPRTIGVVTSPTGAVIQDILNVLSRRFPTFHLILNPVKVQGEGAAEEIAKAIEQFNKYELADVLIIGRGGGSLEDLFAFNEEVVASAIFHSKIPTISAVGHETDFTLADHVADVRAPTPSAAAEIVTLERSRHLEHLVKTRRAMLSALLHQLKGNRHRLEGFMRHPLLSSPYALLGQAAQRLDDLHSQITLRLQEQLSRKKLQLQNFGRQLSAVRPERKILHLKEKLTLLTAHLKALDPNEVLKKGYAILFHENSSSIIFSSKEAKGGEEILIRFHDGEVRGKIHDV